MSYREPSLRRRSPRRRGLLRAALFAAAALLAGTGTARDEVGATVGDAWVRATVQKQQATGAFMELSAPVPLRLVQVQSPVADIVEIHEMTMVNDVMRMRAVDAIAIAPGKPVRLEPGGFHVMLIDLRQQIQAGDAVPLTLTFEGSDGRKFVKNVTATARALNAAAPGAAKAHGKGAH